jgi:hypothetical protein
MAFFLSQIEEVANKLVAFMPHLPGINSFHSCISGVQARQPLSVGESGMGYAAIIAGLIWQHCHMFYMSMPVSSS